MKMTVRDQVFLYCYLIYGPKEEILSVLPQPRIEMLKKELRKFDRFPKEVRLTLVLKLLGYLVQHVKNRHLEMVHPSWIAEALRKENPQTAFMILNQLAPDHGQQVLRCLGQLGRAVTDPIKSTPTESGSVLFQIFCSRFAAMSAPWGDPELSIETIYLLKEEDLLMLIRQTGLRELARAFAPAGRNALAAVVTRFPSEQQENFLSGINAAKNDPPEKQKLATKRLSQYDLASLPVEEVTVKIGIAKIGGALHNRRDVVWKIAQRLPRDLGLLLLEAEKEESAVGDEANEVLETLQDLINRGKIDKAYVETRFALPAESRVSRQNILS